MQRTMLILLVAGLACCTTDAQLDASTPLLAGGPFTGVWQACDGAGSPDECSKYVLLQHGDRICGTWSYIATGKTYEGRLVARARSATGAQRLQVCGRVGSESRVECDTGWERIDRPLQLCDGGLVDIESHDGVCRAQYTRASDPTAAVELAREAWLRTCLGM